MLTNCSLFEPFILQSALEFIFSHKVETLFNIRLKFSHKHTFKYLLDLC